MSKKHRNTEALDASVSGLIRQMELPFQASSRRQAEIIKFPSRPKVESEALKRILEFASRLPGR